MINRNYHSGNCIIEFIKTRCEKAISLSLFPNFFLKNSIKHEYSSKILYLTHSSPGFRRQLCGKHIQNYTILNFNDKSHIGRCSQRYFFRSVGT